MTNDELAAAVAEEVGAQIRTGAVSVEVTNRMIEQAENPQVYVADDLLRLTKKIVMSFDCLSRTLRRFVVPAGEDEDGLPVYRTFDLSEILPAPGKESSETYYAISEVHEEDS